MYGIAVDDYDGDGKQDIVMGGNSLREQTGGRDI